METATIEQSVLLPAPPALVFETLLNPRQHQAFTGAGATGGLLVGDAFTAYDGYISGKHLELVPGSLIVQSWVAEEENWPAGHESQITFRLSAEGTGTRLHFTHTGVPQALENALTKGWEEWYWQPLKAFLEGWRKSEIE